MAMNLTMNIHHILDVTLKNVIRSLKIKRGGVFLIDHNTHKIKLEASLGLPVEAPNAGEGVMFNRAENTS